MGKYSKIDICPGRLIILEAAPKKKTQKISLNEFLGDTGTC
jgi:hypothetical protein